jgi:hypothetical protein
MNVAFLRDVADDAMRSFTFVRYSFDALASAREKRYSGSEIEQFATEGQP